MKVNLALLKSRRAELDLSSDEAAKLLGISGGYLRHIEAGSQEPSARLVHRMARVYELEFKKLVASNDGVPDEPPEQPPQKPTGPPGRKNGSDDRRGPPPTRRPRPAGAVA